MTKTVKNYWRRGLAVLAALVVLCFCVVLGGLLYMNTDAGRNDVVAWANAYFEGSENQVIIGNVDGSLFSDFKVSNVDLVDDRGTWLEIEKMSVSWSPLSLLSGDLSIKNASIERVGVNRLPSNSSSSSDAASAELLTFSLPSLPVNLIVKQFDAETIDIKAGIIGLAARFNGQGAVRYASDGAVVLKAELIGQGKYQDRLAVDIKYPEEIDQLSADVSIVAPSGGFFGAIAGIDAQYDMFADFKGRGSLNNWEGALSARVGDTVIAKADINLVGQALNISVLLDAGEYISDGNTALFGRTASLNFDVKPTENQNVRTLSLSVSADTMQLDAQGNVSTDDLAVADAISFTFGVTKAEPFNRIFAPASFQPFQMSGTLTGLATEPKLKARLSNNVAVTYDGISASVSGSFEMSLKPQSITVNADGQIEGIQGEKVTAYQNLLNQQLDWSTDLAFNRQTPDVLIEKVTLKNAEIFLSVSGAVADSFNSINGDVAVVLSNISALVPDMSGQVNVAAKFEQNAADTPLEIRVELDTDNITQENETLNALLGGSQTGSATIVRSIDGSIAVNDLNVQSEVMSVTGVARVNAEQIIESGDFEFNFENLSQLGDADDVQLVGDVEVSVNLSGPVSSPSVSLATNMRTLQFQSVQLEGVDIQAQITEVFSTPSGKIEVSGETNLGSLSAKTNIVSNNAGTFSLSELDIKLGQYAADGALKFVSNTPVVGIINITTESEGSRGLNDYGTIQGKIELSNQSNQQQIALSGNIESIVLPVSETDLLTVDQGAISASVLISDVGPLVTGSASLGAVSHPRFQTSSFEFKADQSEETIEYSARAEGTKFMPYSIAASGSVVSKDEGRLVSLKLDGTVGDNRIKNSEFIELGLTNSGFSLAPFTLSLGEGSLQGEASSMQGGLIAKLKATQVDTAISRIFFPEIPIVGVLNGNLELSANVDGTPNSAKGTFDTTLDDVRVIGSDLVNEQGFKLNVTGEFLDNKLSISGKAQLASELDAQFGGAFPLEFDPANASFKINPSQSISGNVAWDGEIGFIWPALALINHDFTGNMIADLTLGGTYDIPDVDGQIRLNGGRYENAQTGFVATNIELASTVTDRRLVVDSLTASDGGKGKVDADAIVQLNKDFSVDADASLRLDEVRLVRLPKMSVTASSALTFVKKGKATSLSGDVTVDSASINAISRSETSVIELDVREINLPEGGVPGLLSADQESRLAPMSLDVNFRAPGQLFIRTYGMDSEWTSDVRITGNSEKPILSGTATLTRGTFDFSGKRFTLTRGNLTFVGDRRNDPLLDISAENQLTDFKAILTIGGKASAPTIEVSSVPSFPQDEILSRIFFGASVADLSPIEAVQLAATIHSLSNGGGQGLIGGIRRTLGIDRLSIDQANARDYGTTITGGKYLTNNIYVEVTTAPATGETATAVEVGLTKNLSLITRRTLDHDNNLAIRWSWNY